MSRARPVRRAGGAVALVVAVAALGGCGIWGPEGGPGGAGGAQATATAPTRAVPAVMGNDGVQRIDITVDDTLQLNPSVVSARTGKIEITFHNTGVTPHDLTIDAPSAAGASAGAGGDAARLADSGNLNGAVTATVTVDVSTPGTYPMPCVYHDTSGMIGTLIVQ